MTQSQSVLDGLVERLKAANGPDRDIDALIAGNLLSKEVKREPNKRTWRMGHKQTKTRPSEPWVCLPSYTHSVDAALVLLEHVLPAWTWTVEKTWRMYACILISQDNEDGKGVVVESAPTPAIAILLATLSALQSQEAL